jgi:hypothetical protein
LDLQSSSNLNLFARPEAPHSFRAERRRLLEHIGQLSRQIEEEKEGVTSDE